MSDRERVIRCGYLEAGFHDFGCMKLLHRSHSISCLAYHVVFCPKFRLPVLVSDVAAAVDASFCESCAYYDWQLHAVEVMPDHVHLFLQLPPTVTVAQAVKTLKSRAAKDAFRDAPKLRKRLWCGKLWTSDFFAGSISGVSEDAIRCYIGNQRASYSQQSR